MVYVIIALFFISVLAIVLLILIEPPRTDLERSAIERVNTMDQFLSDFESDIDRAAYISGFRALLAMEEYTAEKGVYFSNLSGPFQEAFVYGSINQTPYAILANATLRDYLVRTSSLAARVGMSLNLTVTNVVIVQPDPWYFTVNITFAVNLTDQRGLASWSYNVTHTTKIPVTGLRDPLYSVNTLGKIQIQVNPTNISTFVGVPGNANDTNATQLFINLTNYRTNPNAPSLMNRFLGNLSASPQGIESIVPITRLSSQGIAINDTLSVVDYLYFGVNITNQSSIATACHIQNLIFVPDWFKLDAAHLPLYNMSSLNYSGCP